MDSAPAEYDPQLDRSFRGHKGPIHALDFNVNMKQLAGASLDHCVYVWNFRQQLRAFRFTGHTVRCLPCPAWLPLCLWCSAISCSACSVIHLPIWYLSLRFDLFCLAALRVENQEIFALI
jgi:hypothetical protein